MVVGVTRIIIMLDMCLYSLLKIHAPILKGMMFISCMSYMPLLLICNDRNVQMLDSTAPLARRQAVMIAHTRIQLSGTKMIYTSKEFLQDQAPACIVCGG